MRSSPMRKYEKRRAITSHSLKLQNFKLGGKYLIFDLIAMGVSSDIYYGVEESTKLERIFKFYNLKEIEESKGFKEKQSCKRMSNLKYHISNSCKSIHILKCLDIYQDRNYKVLVYQYCDKSLKDEIESRQDKKISEIRAIFILKQILSALKSLHLNAQMLHTNLKPEKIMVKNGIYKLADFGFPSLSDDQTQNSNDFLAPEIINRRSFNQKAQVWSIGVLFYQILYGKLPEALREGQRRQSQQHTDQSIFQNSEESRTTSFQVISFLKSCLYVDPQARMGLQELECHPIFSMVSEEQPKIVVKKTFLNTISSFILPMMPEIQQLIPQKKQKEGRLSVMLPITQEKQIVESLQKQKLDQLYKQIFHMGLYRKKIQKQLEKQYTRYGYSFEIQQLQKTSIAYLRSQVNKDEAQTYKQMKQYYLQCLKVEFIFFQILEPLLRSAIKQERQQIELFYLILSTCFAAISRLNLIQKDQKQLQTQYQNLLTNCVQKSTEILYQKIEQNQNKYSHLLTNIENSVFSMFNDRFSKIFSQAQFADKDLYLTGVEKIDFTAKQKISFTYKFFNQNKIKMQSARRNQKQLNSQVTRAFQYMQIYVEIWEISNQKEIQQRYPSLKGYIDKELVLEMGSSSLVRSQICCL